MGKGSDPKTEFFMPPVLIPPSYGYESTFMQDYLPGITGMGAPRFEGQADPGLTPTQQAAIHSAQQFATSGPQMSQDIMGFLGNMMGGGGAYTPTFQPGLSDYTLSQFMQPPGGPGGGWGPFPMGLGLGSQGGTAPGGGLFTPPGQGGGGGAPDPFGRAPGEIFTTPAGGTGYYPGPQNPGPNNGQGIPPGGVDRLPPPWRQQVPRPPPGTPGYYGPGEIPPGSTPAPGGGWYEPGGGPAFGGGAPGGGVPGRQGSESRFDPYRPGAQGAPPGAAAQPPSDPGMATGPLPWMPGAGNSAGLHGIYRPLVNAALGGVDPANAGWSEGPTNVLSALGGMQPGGSKADPRLDALMQYTGLGNQLNPLFEQWSKATDPAQKSQFETQARGMIEGAWNALPEQARAGTMSATDDPRSWLAQYVGAGAGGAGGGGGAQGGAMKTGSSSYVNAQGQPLQVSNTAGASTGWNPTTQKWESASVVRGPQQGTHGSGQTDAGREGDPLMKNWWYNMPFPYEGKGGLFMPRVPTSQFGGYGIPAYQPIQGARPAQQWDPMRGVLPIQGADVGRFPIQNRAPWPTQPNPTPNPTGPGGEFHSGAGGGGGMPPPGGGGGGGGSGEGGEGGGDVPPLRDPAIPVGYPPGGGVSNRGMGRSGGIRGPEETGSYAPQRIGSPSQINALMPASGPPVGGYQGQMPGKMPQSSTMPPPGGGLPYGDDNIPRPYPGPPPGGGGPAPGPGMPGVPGGQPPGMPVPPGAAPLGGLNQWGTAQDPIGSDIYGYYNEVMKKVKGDITKQTGEQLAGAGFTGNRYGSAAMDQVADVVGRNMAGVGSQFADVAYRSGQDAMNRLFQGNQGDLGRQLQAAGMGQDMQRFLYGLQSQNANQGLDRMMQAAQMGLGASGQYDQQMQQRLAALQGAGASEQERQDFYNQLALQNFEQNKWGTLPMLPAFMGGQPIQSPSPTGIQTPGKPGGFDYLLQAAAVAAPYIGMGAAMSDRTLKKDIRDTGVRLGPLKVKEWTWRDDGKRDRGFIAQEVERYAPHAVIDVGGKKAIRQDAVLDFLFDYAVRNAKPVAGRRAA